MQCLLFAICSVSRSYTSIYLVSVGMYINSAHMVLKGHRSIVNQVRFNPANHLIISSGVEKIIKVKYEAITVCMSVPLCFSLSLLSIYLCLSLSLFSLSVTLSVKSLCPPLPLSRPLPLSSSLSLVLYHTLYQSIYHSLSFSHALSC